MGRKLASATAATVAAVVLAGGAVAGSFSSSDPLLDRAWAESVHTADDVVAAGPLTTDAFGRPCRIDVPVVVLDGVVRDRCVYVGDLAVDFDTFDASTPRFDLQRSLLAWFGNAQTPEGAIPASPAGEVLADYTGYWILALHDYVLYSGDVGLAREMWAHVRGALDRWYAGQLQGGLVVSRLAHEDYAYIRRRGDTVAYYNAEYVLALRDAAQLAQWVGDGGSEERWRAQAAATAMAFGVFWDAAAGAYHDTTADPATHPQDGNAFAILAGIATPDRARSALGYLQAHDSYSYGNSIADAPTWDDPAFGYQSNMRVYPFMSYFELRARFQEGLDGSALDLIRREWGYMAQYGPGTTWEMIAPYGGGPAAGSWAHGWSSGAAAALTSYVLGVVPTSPGYATYSIEPHPGGLSWAKGDVETPRGLLHVEWHTAVEKGKTRVVVSSSLAAAGQ